MDGPPADAPTIIEITVKNVMAGKAETKVRVPTSCTVRGLKLTIAERCDVLPERQLLLFNDKELKDDDAKIADLGMTTDCMVTLSVCMNTGVEKPSAGQSSLIFYVPISLPSGPGLRNSVRLMTTVKGRSHHRPKKAERPPENAHTWTPEKKLEIELTRNRMKSLIKKRKKTHILSPATGTPVDAGSVLGSKLPSPCQTPPNEMMPGAKKASGNASTDGSLEIPEVTERELKLFFEPMETLDQLERMKRTKAMAPPPQNEQELVELKERLAIVEKTCCKMCGKKLPAVEQTMLCRCKKLFCRNHRDPQDHLCKIDYKQTGRTRIHKENPRVGDGGVRKGKL